MLRVSCSLFMLYGALDMRAPLVFRRHAMRLLLRLYAPFRHFLRLLIFSAARFATLRRC